MKYFNSKVFDYLYFAPILILFSVIIIFVGREIPIGDGARYWNFSENLLNGFYANKDLAPGFLWNGPGYPLFLTFLRVIGFNVFWITLMNALLIYFGSIIFYRIIIYYLNKKQSIFITYLMVLSNLTLPIYSTYLYTEPLTFLLIIIFIQNIHKIFLSKGSKYIFFSSIIFSFLILTKVFFAYLMLLGFITLFFIKNDFFKKVFYVFVLTFLFTIPYQTYTYKITGKYFYWSDAGGDLLYWISSPHEIDLGQWQEGNSFLLKQTIKNKYNNLSPDLVIKLNEIIFDFREYNHGSFIDSLSVLSGIKKDELLKKRAFSNIINNKVVFLKNWSLNLSRLFTGSPTSLYFKPPNTPIKQTLNIVFSSFLFVLFMISILIFCLTIKRYNYFIYFIIIFGLSYVFGISLLANQSQRFLIPITPILFLFSSIIYSQNIKLVLKKAK